MIVNPRRNVQRLTLLRFAVESFLHGSWAFESAYPCRGKNEVLPYSQLLLVPTILFDYYLEGDFNFE